jgi:hypothetical protein
MRRRLRACTDDRVFVDAICLGILAVQVTNWVKFSLSERKFTKVVVVSINTRAPTSGWGVAERQTFCCLITTATTV